jgi:hypothetical protein
MAVGCKLGGAQLERLMQRPAFEWGPQLCEARVHLGCRRLELHRRAADGSVELVRHASVQRADEQVSGVQPLLRRIVQLPRDPLPLGLDREPLALGALDFESPQCIGRVGQRGHEQERQAQMDRERLGRDDLKATPCGAADDRHDEECE